jgi:hypothetical protein
MNNYVSGHGHHAISCHWREDYFVPVGVLNYELAIKGTRTEADIVDAKNIHTMTDLKYYLEIL